jgi:hypothetical protein
MAAELRHKYVAVLGSCCTADAIRTKNLEDISGARLRLLWYQGRTSLLSMVSDGLGADEYACTNNGECSANANWGLTMVLDEVNKRQRNSLIEVIGMSDALVLDVVSSFVFPYRVAEPGNRYFLCSKEWERYVVLQVKSDQKRLWDLPMQLSLVALREVLEPLYERQPGLRVIFHLPRPCFNDGITFDDPQVAAKLDYYFEYGDRLYSEASRAFPMVSVVNCGGEHADPFHYNYPYPFHYDESYMEALRKEIERLLE